MAAPGISSNLALINGPLLLGTLFGYALFGILLVQVYMYSQRFPKDPVWTKVLVRSVFCADIILTVLPTIVIWRLLISGWGDPATIGLLEWPFIGITIVSGYVATAVHVFFSWRIWKLRQFRVLPCVVVAMSFVAWGMEATCGVLGVTLGTAKVHEVEPFAIVSLSSEVASHLSRSILLRGRSQTVFKKLSGVIRRLIQLTVETAMITTIGATSQLIIFSLFPENNLHFLLFLMLAKLYSNSLLTTLNARPFINPVETSISLPLWEDQLQLTAASGGGTVRTATHASPNSVHITTFTKRHRTCPDHRGSVSDVSLGDTKAETI